jgi:tetratricopeptide (TPR) repeat protein
VKNFRRAPGNFTEWRKVNQQFDPVRCPHVQDAMEHVLQYALRGLEDKTKKVLQTIAAFRMPATYDTLAALFVENTDPDSPADTGHAFLNNQQGTKLFASELELDIALKELEDRGLMGWDKRANRYDLHPIVRSVVWSRVHSDTRHAVFTSLQEHFNSVKKVDVHEVNSYEDLTPAIELYNTLIGLSRWDDAFTVLSSRLNYALYYRLSANRQYAELLEMLFTDGIDQLPRLSNPRNQSFTINALAQAYQFSGQPGRAVPLYQKSYAIDEKEGNPIGMSIESGNLAYVLWIIGALRESEFYARRALAISRKFGYRIEEGQLSNWLGMTLSTRGLVRESEIMLRRARNMCAIFSQIIWEDVANHFLAQRALWMGNPVEAQSLADQVLKLARKSHHERSFSRIPRIQGTVEFELGNLDTAYEYLNLALTRARSISYVDEELCSLVALSKLQSQKQDFKAAHEFLDDVWELAERGPYTLIHADAFNVLVQIERDTGNTAAAIEAATKAYRLAWCDGPPFAYHWGLEIAKKHLKELDAPEPQMPPFDETKHKPLEKIEIDPDDEFHVGKYPVM